MFLLLPFVETPVCHRCVAGIAFNTPMGIASRGAFNDGAPPGAPVS